MLQSSQSLHDVFIQALLAQAAYADLGDVAFSDVTTLREELIAAGMTGPAAAYVAKYYGVLHHEPNTESGYSGTLFARRAAIDSPAPTGDITFAIRGTEPWPFAAAWDDIVAADLWGIGFDGQARGQALDMMQHWGRIAAGTAGYELEAVVHPLLAEGVSVTGHSLGGHLATLFSHLNPSNTYKHIYGYSKADGRACRLTQLQAPPAAFPVRCPERRVVPFAFVK